MNEKLKQYQEGCIEELHALLGTLVGIPAPSYHEKERAEFCKAWLEDHGATGVYIDDEYNCVYPINCEGRDDLIAFTAHTDTVFPDLEPFEMKRDETNFYAPGVGDDTASVAIVLMVLKFILENGLKAKRGVLIAFTSGEEGLGNCKGARKLMKDYAGRIKEFYSFDGRYNKVTERCIGAHRYEIECKTQGGHSYGDFRREGRRSAIEYAAKLIGVLYEVEEPKVEGYKTTYNVGMIEGGTSVNTIAESAKIFYEYRSDHAESLDVMEKKLGEIMERVKSWEDVEFTLKRIGDRPCAVNVNADDLNRMIERVIEVSTKYSGMECPRESGSTDCNIPLSLGVPATCLGIWFGRHMHRRDEFLEIASLPIGLRIACDMILEHFE